MRRTWFVEMGMEQERSSLYPYCLEAGLVGEHYGIRQACDASHVRRPLFSSELVPRVPQRLGHRHGRTPLIILHEHSTGQDPLGKGGGGSLFPFPSPSLEHYEVGAAALRAMPCTSCKALMTTGGQVHCRTPSSSMVSRAPS